MGFEFFGGRRLLFAGSRLGWFWALALAAAVVLLVVLYREERRLVTRRAGLFLLALRLAAAAALVLALFEPISALTLFESERGRAVVAVDISESMATVDLERTALQQDKLARTLGLERAADAAGLSRREVARRLIEGNRSPVGRLAGEHALEAFAFARETAPASLPALAEALKGSPRPGDPALAETDWEPVLSGALKPGSSQAPVTSVVLLTDGQRNGPVQSLPTVDRLAARGVKVYSILIGSIVPPRDAAVAAVKAPETVYRGDVATIAATIKIDGFTRARCGRDAGPARCLAAAPVGAGAG